MTLLILGLLVFLGVHSVRIVAEGWRSAQITRLGEMRWKGVYSLLSIAGFVLLVWGYGLARQAPVLLWTPPRAMGHVAALLMLPSLILLAAAYVPGNAIKARLRHPMVLGIKTWALAHLLANGNLADVLLFGAFLIWAVASFSAARRRDRGAAAVRASGTTGATVITVLVGALAWGAFVFWLHALLIGVAPLA